jgi:hypothetical protein
MRYTLRTVDRSATHVRVAVFADANPCGELTVGVVEYESLSRLFAYHQPGQCEATFSVWISGLGELSPVRAGFAAQVLTLARQMDQAWSMKTPAAATAALSRELRTAVRELREAADSRPVAVAPMAEASTVADELAAARERRREVTS